MSHGTHTNESSHTHAWGISRVQMSFVTCMVELIWHNWMGYVIRTNKACHTHMKESCHTRMKESCHTHMKESYHTYKYGMWHLRTSHGTYTNKSCHICEWVMSHLVCKLRRAVTHTQHTAPRCTTQRHTAPHLVRRLRRALQHTATHCNTL